jgi:UTP:GlnB (protein PII) uridylyltransferase
VSSKGENSSSSAEAASLAKGSVAAARARIRERAASAADPAPLLRELADSLDTLLVSLFAGVPRPPGRLALVAMGSYGRRELFPYSDVDLLLIHQGQSPATVERVIEGVIYPLWDAKLAVGHAVRDIDEALDLAGEDLTLRTALLDARFLAGDERLLRALAAGAREIFRPERLNDFQRLLVEERRQRHERFGETVYLLEPNIKSGAGGLRDINTGLWAAKARFGVEGIADLVDHQLASRRQQEELVAARTLLSRLRLAMHLATGRAQDRLLFELQEQLASALFPADTIPGGRRRGSAVAPAVERLMHAFYRAARTVVLETEGLLQRSFVVEETPPPRRIDRLFEVRGRSLACSSPEVFWEQPSELLRVFAVAAREGVRLDRALQDTVAEAAAGEPGAQLVADTAAIERWRELLVAPEAITEPGAAGARSLLERMHDLGVLGRADPRARALHRACAARPLSRLHGRPAQPRGGALAQGDLPGPAGGGAPVAGGERPSEAWPGARGRGARGERDAAARGPACTTWPSRSARSHAEKGAVLASGHHRAPRARLAADQQEVAFSGAPPPRDAAPLPASRPLRPFCGRRASPRWWAASPGACGGCICWRWRTPRARRRATSTSGRPR